MFYPLISSNLHTGRAPLSVVLRPGPGRHGTTCLLLAIALSTHVPPSTAADLDLSLLGRREIACPVCDQTFTTLTCTQTNTRGGIDRDLFARALGPQPEFFHISTCPACGYSGYLSDFAPGVRIQPDVIEKIRRQPKLPLPAGFGPESDPRELDATDRYELAITCYRWLQKSDEALAWLYLRLSWVHRDRGSILPPDPRLEKVFVYIKRWRPPLAKDGNQMDVEMGLAARVAEAVAAGEFNRYQKPYVELALALLLRSHGETQQAVPLLERLYDHEGFSASLREGIGRMQESMTEEQRCQRQAVAFFERALLSDQIASDNRTAAKYITAELHRRLGRHSTAIRWYDEVLEDRRLDPHLRTWARQQREWCPKKDKDAAPTE